MQGDQVWFGHLGIIVFTDWIFFMARQSPMGQDLRIIDAPRSHSDTPHSLGLHRTSYQPDAEPSTWQHTTPTRQTSKPPAGFETAIPASEWSQYLALDCAATGIGTIGGDANMNNSGGSKQIYVTLRLAWQLPALLMEEKNKFSLRLYCWRCRIHL